MHTCGNFDNKLGADMELPREVESQTVSFTIFFSELDFLMAIGLFV